MRRFLLGIDVGTTGCKVGLFSLSGESVALSRADYGTSHPQSGYAEQDPLAWWDAVKRGLQQIMARSDITPKEIAAVGVDSHMPTLLPVNHRGDVLYPALIWSDNRAIAEATWIKQKIEEAELIRICGNACTSQYLAPKIKWYQSHAPHAFKETHLFLQANGYINYKLTGNFSMDRSNCETTLLADKVTGAWSQEICTKLEIPIEKLPEVKDCTAIIGSVTKEAAKETGLAQGIPVIAGGNDTAVSVFTLNIAHSGQAFLDIGHATNPGICLAEPESCGVCNLYHHVLPNLWILQAFVGTTGAALRWFKDNLGEAEIQAAKIHKRDAYELLSDIKAAQAEPGSCGLIFLPYLEGDLGAPEVKGTLVGLSTSTSKADIVRSLLEGCAFAVRRNLELIEEVAGIKITELFTAGGGANSSLWCQIHADVTGKRILLPKTRDGAVMGSALLAGIGIGVLPPDLAIKGIAPIEKIYEPCSENKDIYQKGYEQFCRVYENLRNYW